MAPSSTLATAAAALLIAASCSSTVEAFAPSSSSSSIRSSAASAFGLPTASTPAACRVAFALHAEEGDAAEGDAAEEGKKKKKKRRSDDDEEAVEEAGEAVAEEVAEDEADAETETEEPDEDAEAKLIKAQIAELEATIKAKRSSLRQVEDMAESYTEGGYMRKVAEMDQIRKTRGAAFKSNEFTARANIVQQFLPILDDLKVLNSKYADNEFAAAYSGIKGSLASALAELGVEDFTAEVGSAVDMMRHEVDSEEYSDEFARNMVIKPIAVGVEIKGNVMRRAKVASSLGSEEEEKAKQAEKEAAKAEAAKEAAVEGEVEEESEAE